MASEDLMPENATTPVAGTDYRTVPVEPTEEMLREGYRAFHDSTSTVFAGRIPDIWTAMLAAAPALSASPAPAGDLVERVAGIIRALKVTDYDSADEIARAVLLAVRDDLDEGVLKAGWTAETQNYTCPYPDEAWPAMIDAILKDAP